MKPINILFITIFLLASTNVNAQQPSQSFTPKIIPPSPNAASIMKFGDIPVSYYTGTPNISAPLYTVEEGELKVPISLSYHPSGIKVAEEASQVGLGWALNAGGLISRNVIGDDDLEGGRYFSPNNNIMQNWIPQNLVQVGPVVAGDASVSRYYFITHNNQNTFLDLKIDPGAVSDYEPDMFSFNFPGGSGKFALTRDKKLIMAEKSDLKITMIEGVPGNYAGANISWEIITPDGTKYLFDEKETYYNPESNNAARHVSSWYLKSITSHTGDVINFSYNRITDAKNHPQGSISETIFAVTVGKACTSDSEDRPIPVENSTIPFRTPPQYTETVYLDKITFSNGYAKFTFGGRDDLFYDKKLEKLEIFRNGTGGATLFKTYSLQYSYFEGNLEPRVPATNEGSISKRLKLISVSEKGHTGEVIIPYTFTYLEGDNFTNLPAKTSFAIDHWGYYNGNLGNTSLIPTYTNFMSTSTLYQSYGVMTGSQRNTNPYYIKAFSLKKITYATGGYTEFDFDTHEYDIKKSKENDNSLARNIPSVKLHYDFPKIYNTNNKGVYQNFTVDLSNSVVSEGGTSTLLSYTAFCRFTTFIPCTTYTPPGNVMIEIRNSSNQIVAAHNLFGMNECTGSDNGPCITKVCPNMQGLGFSNTLSLTPGVYTCRILGQDGNDYTIADIQVGFNWYANLETVAGAKTYAGGLRVKKITDYDGEKQTVKKFDYTLTELDGGVNIEKSSGRLMTLPQYTYAEDKVCFGDPDGYNAIYRSSNSIIPLNASASGSVVGYDKVTVTYGENGENGKSVFYYDNQSDKVNNYSFYRPPTISSIPYKGNGALKKKQDFNKDGFLLKEVENSYYLTAGYNVPLLSPSTSQYLYALEKRPYGSINGGSLMYTPLHGFFYPAINRSIMYLQSTTERIFDAEDATNTRKVETVTSYTYPNETYDVTTNSFTKTYLQPTYVTKTNSKGQLVKTEYKYPYDYPTSTYTDMTGLNIVNPTIEEKTSIGNSQINKKLTNYFKPLNTFYAPENIQTQLTSTSTLVTDVTFNSYDSKGNVTKYTGRDGIANSFEYFGISDAGKVNLVKTNTVGEGSVAQTTTYDYDPLKGVSSVTDPREQKTKYEYDGLGRLLHIRDNDSKLVKSYQYNYQTPTSSAGNASLNFTAQLDLKNREIDLSFSFATPEVVKYEIRRGQGSEPLKLWVTVPGNSTTKIDPSYTPQQNVYKYEIRAILSNGTATEWKPLNITLPANCTNNYQIIKNGLISASQPKVDKACYEIIFEEGFITEDNADYSAEIETP